MKKTVITFSKLIVVLLILYGANFNNASATNVRITYIQHDGFIIRSDNLTFYLDMTVKPNDSFPSPDVIFITHNHADHFVNSIVTNLATTSGAYVVGPQPVITALSGSLPGAQLISYAPSTGSKMTDTILGVNLTIYGSYDGTPQNSYRLEFPSGVVVYLNGDMPGALFGAFVSNGCTELLNMNIAMLDSWAYTLGDFYSSYNPDVMIKMHNWSSPCVVYPDYPTSFNLTSGNTYIYASTAINENPDSKNDIKVFPNPSNNITNIEFSNTKNESHTLTIYNINGQEVRKIENITNEAVKVENRNLENGMYFFQLQNNKGIIGEGKFLIER
jgi:L-ascorbate metabolism protein UlaG (beta-lactamase superfamily)